jgi:acetyl esterase/lipase
MTVDQSGAAPSGSTRFFDLVDRLSVVREKYRRHDRGVATKVLFEELVAAGVPAVSIVFPHAEHGFDLMLPRWSPAAQTAWYYQDRFLALMSQSAP